MTGKENISSHGGREPEVSSDARTSGTLQMSREQMLALGQKALELVVERIERLAGENAWEGEFRQVLEDQLLEDPPEEGRPAAEVIERAGREAGHPECATVCMSDQSHSALSRAAFIIGIRRDCIRMIGGGGRRLRPALPAGA